MNTSFTESPPEFSDTGQVVPPDRWWTTFGDAALDQQIDQAFDESYTLAGALQRVVAARALARREASNLWPDVDGTADISSVLGPGDDRTVFTWGLDASYQVDLWGQIGARVDAELFRAQATYEDYQTVALTLSAEIARTWFSLIESYAQLELLDEQIETNQTGAELQGARFGLGLIRSPDVLRQRQLVEATREQVVIVQARVEVLEHQLAILLGQPPQNATYDTGAELPNLPPLPSTGLSSELLPRRPDVRADYFALLGADRDLAAAISDQYPRLNLTGSVLNVADRSEDIFRNWFVSLGSQLIGPIIDGGQRRAEVDRTTAVTRLRFNEYGDTVLNAFREVEDGLALEEYQLQRIARLQAQSILAKQSYEQLREQYLIGDATYLDVLSAITAQQRLQRDTLTAQLDLLLIRVSLYLALAGGFDTADLNRVNYLGASIDPELEEGDLQLGEESLATEPILSAPLDGDGSEVDEFDADAINTKQNQGASALSGFPGEDPQAYVDDADPSLDLESPAGAADAKAAPPTESNSRIAEGSSSSVWIPLSDQFPQPATESPPLTTDMSPQPTTTKSAITKTATTSADPNSADPSSDD
ncbi:MAG: TolC family protein [Planctomycetota bacterium]